MLLVNDGVNDTKAHNQKEKPMTKYTHPVVNDMVHFIDRLMSLAYPKITKKLSKAKKKRFILKFFKRARIIELKHFKKVGRDMDTESSLQGSNATRAAT